MNTKRLLILIVITICYFMSFIDLIIINIVMPSIIDCFKGGADKSEWLISGYSLSISIVLLCSSWLSSKFGLRRTYIVGIVVFTLASLLSSMASSMESLIVMRMLQGVGSGIIIPLSMSLIAQNFTERSRGLAIGILIMSAGIAVSAGPFLGGYFVEIGKWDWVFKMNVPIGVMATILALFVLKGAKKMNTPKFDYIGVALLVIWTSLSLYLLSSDVHLGLIAVVIVSFGLFVLRMMYAKDPLIEISIFKNKNFILAFVVTFCFGMVTQGGNYAFSEYLLYGLDYSSYRAGILFIPYGMILVVAAPLTGFFAHKFGNRIFILLGLFVTLLYLYFSSRFTTASPDWYILMTLFLRGLGIGLSSTALTNLSFDGIKTENIASASGVISMGKQLAGSFSVATIALLLAGSSDQTDIAEKYTQTSDFSFLLMIGLVVISIMAMFLIKNKTVS